MLNEPPKPERPERRHPLEEPPPAPPVETSPPRQQAILHIHTVKPLATYILLAVNIIVFAVGYFSPNINNEILFWGWNLPRTVLVDGEYHRLLTAMFLHANVAHLFFNMYMLYILGSTVEQLFGHVRFSVVYFAGGLLGSILSAVFGNFLAPSIGASGAVFALLGAEAVYLYRHRKLMGKRGRSRLNYLVALSAINLVIGFANPRIDNLGHIGGLLGGVVLTWFIGPFFLLRIHPDYKDQKHLLGEDINPLAKKYHALAIYAAVLLGILVIGVASAR